MSLTIDWTWRVDKCDDRELSNLKTEKKIEKCKRASETCEKIGNNSNNILVIVVPEGEKK